MIGQLSKFWHKRFGFLHNGALPCQLTSSAHQVDYSSMLARWAGQVTPPSQLFKCARQVDSEFVHQVTPPKRLIKVSPKSAHQVSSPSRLTKSARPHVPPSPQVHSPSRQFKCAHQVDSLSFLTKPIP